MLFIFYLSDLKNQFILGQTGVTNQCTSWFHGLFQLPII